MKKKKLELRICSGFFALTIAALIGFSSCKNTSTDDSNSPSVPGTVGVGGTVVNAAGFFLSLVTTEVNSVLHVDDGASGTTNFTTACKIAPTVTAKTAAADILCIQELPEYDIYFRDLVYQIHVPSTMCDYLEEDIYWFYAYAPGVGPTTVSYRNNANGTVTNVANAPGGKPTCTYDYTATDGPNCCEGKYTLTVATEDPQNPGQFSTATSVADWGGRGSNCVAGQAALGTHAKTVTGYPKIMTNYISGEGYNQIYEMKAPIHATFNSKEVSSNLVTANFFKLVDNGGAAPTPVQPVAGFPTPQAYYEWRCMDRYAEINYRIRMMIRDWNTASITSGGDPDVVGNEAIFVNPFAPVNFLNNDFADWKDFLAAYPQGSL
ncbi:hypothetical protein K2X30_13520 [bacterium]|jgi:hypothetical protein|nr:hypothetical protein [bacterium]